MIDEAQQARDFEQFLYKVEDLAHANYHAQQKEDIKLARKLGVPEPVIQAEVRRVDNAFSTAQECALQHMRGNRHRDLWRAFKRRMLNENALCGLCLAAGYRTLTTEIQHLVVHGGDPEKMFNPALVKAVCGRHFLRLGGFTPKTDGIDS